MYNERLYSREGAAELLGISVSTLADYELGNTKVVPVDKVVLMADLYNAPELKTGYCKHECPICSYLPVTTEAKGLEQKLKWVVQQARGLLPKWLQVIMSEEVLLKIIDWWFKEVKDLLDDGKVNGSQN